jgi:hypothetical protein
MLSTESVKIHCGFTLKAKALVHGISPWGQSGEGEIPRCESSSLVLMSAGRKLQAD